MIFSLHVDKSRNQAWLIAVDVQFPFLHWPWCWPFRFGHFTSERYPIALPYSLKPSSRQVAGNYFWNDNYFFPIAFVSQLFCTRLLVRRTTLELHTFYFIFQPIFQEVCRKISKYLKETWIPSPSKEKYLKFHVYLENKFSKLFGVCRWQHPHN